MSTTTNQIDLMPFCASEAQFIGASRRYQLDKPFRCGDHIAATDGRVLVRVEPEVWSGEVAEPSRVPRIGEVLRPMTLIPSHAWKPLPKLKPCNACDGHGDKQVVCDCNAGKCTCECCEAEHDCGQCGGTGFKVSWCKVCVVHIGTRKLFRHFARLFYALPNCQWATADLEPLNAVFFRFDGGIGAAMPVNQKQLAEGD